MAYSRGHFEIGTDVASSFGQNLGLKNLGVSIYVFARGEGFDFFHNHREQEEIYLCLDGSVDLKIGGDEPETITLVGGDIVRVDPAMLRAIGNESSERGTVLIAGACPHPYPAGFGHHDVIADVLSIVGKGDTGFTMPPAFERDTPNLDDTDC